jgi:pyrroline-5-carboxylate reductase
MNTPLISFIGGGNMASAILGGLIANGTPASALRVVEPFEAQRDKLARDFGIQAQASADARLQGSRTVVWAVKPQTFREAAQGCATWVGQALQLSVMAGIRCAAIEQATAASQVVRCMPNTPALIGQGMTGLYARPGVSPAQCREVEALLAPTGQLLWVEAEEQLDAVTALSGSGPAYVFYFVEAMMRAAEQMGLSAEQGRQLALGTFAGATELARRSDESPAVLRERVTSKGGTTYAALTRLEQQGVGEAFVQALQAARLRAKELGDEFGG